jgi:hypothetical protein
MTSLPESRLLNFGQASGPMRGLLIQILKPVFLCVQAAGIVISAVVSMLPCPYFLVHKNNESLHTNPKI